MKKRNKCVWLQVREWDRWGAARVEEAAVGMTGGHQGLHRNGGKPSASFLWLPGELAMVLVLLNYPVQRKTIFLCCQRWRQGEQKERTSQLSIPGNMSPQPILTSYLRRHLHYNHINPTQGSLCLAPSLFNLHFILSSGTQANNLFPSLKVYKAVPACRLKGSSHRAEKPYLSPSWWLPNFIPHFELHPHFLLYNIEHCA